ncbi:MAG: FAD-binding protein [Planctomycetota bacterium]
MIERSQIELEGLTLPVHRLNTAVVGSGAAGLNCAARLFREMEETGVVNPAERVAVVTAGMGSGTSHNSGSDKQTYYKLGMRGEQGDTAAEFAETLTRAGCCHGDLALIEGENSLRCFHRLVELGVPFPHNERGGFVGYKTDHDPRQRATSAGPWTSRFMVRKLRAELQRYGVVVFDNHYALAVLTEGSGPERRARGLLCVKIDRQRAEDHGLVLFDCRNVVVAGGGPGELYEVSVYPKGQMGPYAALLEAGAEAQNLTELQFGLASLEPRWNLSGTYQQAIPRYYSTDRSGGDVREFLNPWFGSMRELATNIFLKGYQWPFDPQKLPGGSSIIDVLVQHEMVDRSRRVFVDFTRNPGPGDGLEPFDPEDLEPEAREYLERSGATQATPIERLAQMNQPSIDLYKQMGVDLREEPLEVGVCCQHCNGGFAVDEWWESNVRNLFVIGELAGTHGVKRPGGSALNAGQVGALRAAERIAHVYYRPPRREVAFRNAAAPAIRRTVQRIRRVLMQDEVRLDADEERREIQHRMTECAGMMRSPERIEHALRAARMQWEAIRDEGVRQEGPGYLRALKLRELALAQRAFLRAIQALLERGAGSRGSHLVADPSGTPPHPDLGDEWRFLPESEELRGEVLGVGYDAETDEFRTRTETVRPVPDGEYWFENTWADFRRAEIYRMDESDKPRPHEAYADESEKD